MRVKRCLALVGVAIAAAVMIDGCSNVLGIDGEYGDRAQVDSSIAPPQDAPSDTRDAANDTVADRTDGDARDVIADTVSDVRVPCDTAPGACVAALPANWELVLFESNRDTGCPVNFVGTDLVASPTAGAGACDCSCTVNANPTCTQGRMATKYGATTSCETNGLALDVPNGNCSPPLMSNLRQYFSGTPLPAVVACTASTVTNDTNVTSTPMRQCSVPNACREEICNGEVPAGFSACVARDGDVACPSGWGTKTVVGDGADLTCSSCTCQATATCSGGRITFYSNTGCGTELSAHDVNDVCQAVTGGGGPIRSFRYTANVTNPQCMANGAKTASVALTGTRTVCCK